MWEPFGYKNGVAILNAPLRSTPHSSTTGSDLTMLWRAAQFKVMMSFVRVEELTAVGDFRLCTKLLPNLCDCQLRKVMPRDGEWKIPKWIFWRPKRVFVRTTHFSMDRPIDTLSANWPNAWNDKCENDLP